MNFKLDRKKKVKLFLVLIGVLYVLSTSYGLLKEDDSNIGKAITKTKILIAEARKEIKKELDKPFILRIFGSLFGMEGNAFSGMKKKLPPILKSAMPDSINFFSSSSESNEITCLGMRLGDALLYLQDQNLEIGHLYWTYDNKLNSPFISFSGTVQEAIKNEQGKADLTLQVYHSYNGENGLGDTEENITENLSNLNLRVQQEEILTLKLWLEQEDNEKLRLLDAKGWSSIYLNTLQVNPKSSLL